MQHILDGDAVSTGGPDIEHRFVDAAGLRMHIAEAGDGPVVLLCHGFPETWYSWRHQLPALAAAGYRAVAPDMRGYGKSDRPEAVDAYTILHLVGDMVALLDALGEQTAVIVGHDWGAPVAWHCALLRPDRFRAVVGVSVPFLERGLVDAFPRRSQAGGTTSATPDSPDRVFYQTYFRAPGLADAEFGADPRRTIRRMLWILAGEFPVDWAAARATGQAGMVSPRSGMLARVADPAELPPWLSEDDVDRYAEDFAATGFTGGLNWYRNTDRNWELLAAFAGARVPVPALFVAGERDAFLSFPGVSTVVDTLDRLVPELRGVVLLEGCGHWLQQERPAEFNAALVDFLGSLP